MDPRREIGFVVSFVGSITCVLLLAVLVTGCKQPSILMKPEIMRTGGAIDESTGELKDIRNAFSSDDAQIVAWVSFLQAHGNQTARFKWYNPEDYLVLDSGPIAISPDNMLYEWRSVWSVLPVKNTSAEHMPGRWKVFTYMNNKKIGTLYLTVDPQ
ncbi:MAG TPA: hypothetical protein PJ991_04500 [Kiritimatiellia bacterium]|nr:hypothetical protein [Kiritimatiellia bacterium]